MKKLKARLERKKEEFKSVLKAIDLIENPTNVVLLYKPTIGNYSSGQCDCECCRGRRREDNYGGLF